MSTLGPVSKVVIPFARVGAWLLSTTKEQLEEMPPLLTSDNGALCLEPVVQALQLSNQNAISQMSSSNA